MKEFKIGGKITISDTESYRIVDIIEKDGKKYYFSCTEKKPILPQIFERVDKDGEVYIKIVENMQIIKEISEKILKENH